MDENPKKSIEINWLNLIGILLIIIACILMIWFFTHGQTTVTGEWTEVKTSESLVCDTDSLAYPFFTYDNSKNKNLRINASFNDDKLQSISLVYMLYYNDTKSITDSSNINHADMNISYGKNGLESDALNTKFTNTPNALQFSIYANSDKVNSVNAQYFMLNDITSGKYSISLMERIYTTKGFNCITNK